MISILIPVLNDTENLVKTISSINTSTSNDIEIIVIDSSINPILLPYKNVRIVRQLDNIGPAQSRHMAAKMAKYDILFMADSHTYFPIGWDTMLIDSFKNKKNQIYAFPVILSRTWEKKYFNYFPVYYGSNIYIKNMFARDDFFDSHIKYSLDNEKLNAIKLAAYGINKEYFFNLRGFSDIKQWGSDELCLTIKVLSNGGNISIIPNTKFIHIHNKSSVVRNLPYIYYNKLRLSQSFMDEESYSYLLDILPRNNRFLENAWKIIERDKDEIQEYRKFYQSIFIKDFKQLRKELNIIE